MGGARNLWLVILGMGAACVEPTDGVGYSSTGEEPEGPASDSGYVDLDPPADHSYFIAESMAYRHEGCWNTNDLNNVTETLQSVLDADGWTGVRMLDGETTPADFIDSFLDALGADAEAGDSALLSVYAGHGDRNLLGWGTPDPTPGFRQECGAKFSRDIRLGRMAGGWARVVLLMASCTGSLDCYESSIAASDTTQALAFVNSPTIWHNAARRFYRNSKYMSNRYAWIRTMDNGGAWKNSPITYTRARSLGAALEIHRSARLSKIEDIPSMNGTTW
jgi:hypothetical protein